ncbi:MAG TPA: hypothetical protein VK957_22130, partial [Lunatimonas sp.]|nr:hypothetical protein [Lunatimonas sp.]
MNKGSLFFGVIIVLGIILYACTRPPANTNKESEVGVASLIPQKKSNSTVTPVDADQRISTDTKQRTQTGVFFMPSWNTSTDPGVDVDSFWSCLQGRGDCAFLKEPSSWGNNGRIFNRQYPYEGPFLDKKPHASLKGFYKRDDPDVARKQIQHMKDYGIDFFVYKWFFGRHYYYHLDYAPQSSIFYPKGWPIDPQRSGRVKVPGIEQWETQLKVLLEENAKLPARQRIKFALSWTDDSDHRWNDWLK